jgi:large conductance mechanosensitive channel
MSFIKEFKAFAMRGNVVDLAVAVIIGGAFGKIVSSLVNDMIMPVISLFMGDKGFKDKFFAFGETEFESLEKAREAGVAIIAYGNFIQTVLDFTILAFVIFLMVKGMNNLKKKEEAVVPAAPEPTKEELLLTEIRDLLKK